MELEPQGRQGLLILAVERILLDMTDGQDGQGVELIADLEQALAVLSVRLTALSQLL